MSNPILPFSFHKENVRRGEMPQLNCSNSSKRVALHLNDSFAASLQIYIFIYIYGVDK